jgi:hypothetical protein
MPGLNTLELPSNSNPISRSRSWWDSSGQWPVLFPVVWLIFYVPRIWRFGFYYGDWSDLLVLNPFNSVWWIFNSRPVSIVIFYVLPRLIGDHPAIWQALLCASMLLASWLFYRILIRVGVLLERPAAMPIGSYRFSADVVVACWLLFPWTLGWTAWPTLLMGQLALLFFLLSMHLLLNAETKGQVVAAAFVYALCNFTYEPFYLAFLPFLLILFIGNERRHFWLMTASLFTVQLVAVGYNRLMAHIMVDGGAAKAVDLSTVFGSLKRVAGLLKALCYSAPQTAKLISTSIIVIAAVTVVSLFLLARSAQKKTALRYSSVLIFSFLMIVVAVVQFGLAAYGLSGIGEASRTTIAVCIWIAVFIFVFLRAARLLTGSLIRPVAIILIVLLMAGCGVALNHQNGLWAYAWRESIRTVKAAPAAEIAKLPPEATVVYVGPSDIETINYISRLPILVALPTYHPQTTLPPEDGVDRNAAGELKPLTIRLTHAPERPVAIRPAIVKTSYQTLSWDGRELVLTLPGYWTEKYRTSLVYEWDAYRDTFRRMEPNAAFGNPPQ